MTRTSRGRSRLTGLGRWFIVIPALIGALIPIYWMVISAFKTDAELGRLSPTLFPTEFTFDQFAKATADGKLLASVANSGLIAILTTLVVLVFGSAAAYAVTQWKFPGVGGVLGLTLFTQLLPQTATLVPIFLLWNTLGLTGSLGGLTIVYCLMFMPVGVWMLIGFFRSLPYELTEAALVDGASRVRILFTVILPMAWPALISVGAYTLIVSWSEFLFALVFLSSNSTTSTVTLASLIGEHDPNIGPLMASATITTLIPLLLFFALQRQFVAGLTGGAVKS
ncbi:carbohydrate ABC transporter permease [Tessaracoccus sp. HDW20]|uniref:carbohydrate ABC transporter permease n=1 Tax=Tessaracoccus coleopterorum TaxID=2714950 RepID=UPI0018D2EFF1|nr:carbohydrate ABC transporter permease [Tessaracoccus coleopterorum]NHB85995.1 carbohydrate ABC transporter permease [Tessaracoccus coleopterorum]